MRIIHVVYNCQPEAHRGGVSKAVHELAMAQHSSGYTVEVWSVSDTAGIDQSYGYSHRKFHGSRWLGSICSNEIVSALQNIERPAVVHLHNTYHALNIQVGRRARILGHKCVYHTHGALDPVLLSGINAKALKKRIYCAFFEIPSLNRANAIIALTSQEQAGLRKMGVTSPIYRVPNGIKVPVVSGGRSRANAAHLDLLYVGRIHPKKRLEDMVCAMPNILQHGYDVRLLITGDFNQFPDYTASIKSKAERLGVSNRILWLGFRDENQKKELFEGAALFVHASESEGMAMAILEAMSYGVPVVASSGCYMSEASSEGALVQYDSGAEALASAILSTLALPLDKRINLGNAGRSYVTKRHSWESIAKRLMEIYESC